MNKSFSKNIALIGLMSATLVVGKLALIWIPYNVECVTFLVILFTAVLGFRIGGPATVIFALVDSLIFGFGIVTVMYLIQFPGIALVTALVSLKKVRSEYVYTVVAFVMVVFFSLHSSLLWCAVSGALFWATYAAGFLFYALNILSACLLTLFAFKPLYKVLKKQFDIYQK